MKATRPNPQSRAANQETMLVAGVMSGTSADGIDVALVRVGGRGKTRFKLVGHASFSYPAAVRRAVLAAMNASSASVADLARLNFVLAELYSEALIRTAQKFGAAIDLVGCHGQTLFHQGDPQTFLGRKIAATWQTGEGSVVATRVGAPVVSDFRPADMAVGGRGAPLVPFLDYLLYRDERVGRIALNLGGIANITAVPAGADETDVTALDTGPGNMVMDALCERLLNQRFDREGRVAARGRILESVLARLLQNPYFARKAPKTAGREQFGREYVDMLIAASGAAAVQDVIATATALTVRSVTDAIARHLPQQQKFAEVIASGGGTRNRTLMKGLEQALEKRGIRVRHSDEFGVPSAAKEAVAFALLAYETWHLRPSNIPAATGARRPAILGKVSYV